MAEKKTHLESFCECVDVLIIEPLSVLGIAIILSMIEGYLTWGAIYDANFATWAVLIVLLSNYALSYTIIRRLKHGKM